LKFFPLYELSDFFLRFFFFPQHAASRIFYCRSSVEKFLVTSPRKKKRECASTLFAPPRFYRGPFSYSLVKKSRIPPFLSPLHEESLKVLRPRISFAAQVSDPFSSFSPPAQSPPSPPFFFSPMKIVEFGTPMSAPPFLSGSPEQHQFDPFFFSFFVE